MSTEIDEKDDDIVAIEVEDKKDGETVEVDDQKDEDDEDSGDEDAKLVEEDDGLSREERNKRNREERARKKEAQKRARERDKRRMEAMAAEIQRLTAQVTEIRGDTIGQTVKTVESDMAAAQKDIETAEYVIARALEEGNAADVVAAMRLRDEAKAKAERLSQSKSQIEQQRERLSQPKAPDPRAVENAKAWMSANTWYNPNGTDDASRITTQIDAELVREGYDPASTTYWKELSERVQEKFDEMAGPKRKAPPVRGNRESVPTGSRKEVYVTPERKQAMIDAGVWDDPVERKRMLQYYRDFDQKNSAR